MVRSKRNNKALGAVEGRLIMGRGEMLVGGEEVLWRREMDTSTLRGLTALATIPFFFLSIARCCFTFHCHVFDAMSRRLRRCPL